MKFSKNLKFTILLPAAVLVIGLIVGIICGGMNLGIDFTGGTMMTIHQKPVVKGDINGDGTVNVADVMALYTTIGSGEKPDAAVADFNGDGIINVADVMALYAFVQNGSKS